MEISIHAPYTRGDSSAPPLLISKGVISIHAPYTRGDEGTARKWYKDFKISIHAPYTRGDVGKVQIKLHNTFQSTPLIQGATIARSTISHSE